MDFKEHFQREGYVIFSDVFSPCEISNFRRVAQEIFSVQPSHHGDSKSVRMDILSHYPDFRPLLSHEKFLDGMRSLFGNNFALLPETSIHDSLYGGWHRDTESQEANGETFHWEAECEMGQVAIYLQENSEEFAGGLTIVPRTHQQRDGFFRRFRIRFHYFYHREFHRRLKRIASLFYNFDRRPINSEDLDRRSFRVANKPGDVVVFDLRLFHRATHPQTTPVPIDKRKFAVFLVCGRTGVFTQKYRDYISTRTDYTYLDGFKYPDEVRSKAERSEITLL